MEERPLDFSVKCNRLQHKSIVSWGALLAGYAESGDACSTFKLFEQMNESGLEPNRAIFLCILKACICVGSLSQGMLVHYEVIKNGLDSDLMVCNMLMDFYVKLSCLVDALKVFDNLLCPDVVSWGIRIAGLADNGFSFAALESYEKMKLKGLKPDRYSYSCVLKACASEGVVLQGKLVHDQVLRCGLESNTVVANTLLDMYGKCAYIGEACKVFHGMTKQDVVSWSTIIARCAEHGLNDLALLYFERMQQVELFPNRAVLICALKACVSAGNLILGRVLHDSLMRGGLGIDLTLGSTLVNMYGTHGSLEEAAFVLNSMKDSNEVTWGLMIAACVQHSHFHAAVGLLRKMLQKGMNVEKSSFIGILKGCSRAGAIIYGRLLHGLLIESVCVDDEVKSALIDMYAKCGSCFDSCKVSEDFSPGKNIAFWDTKIASFAYAGRFDGVQHCLQTMASQAVKPDRMMFLGLLSACCGAGVFEEGCEYFASMRNDYGIEPGIDEYNSIVDLLGRVGFVEEAEALLLSMPFYPDLVGWMSLLSRCKALFNIGLARRSFNQIILRDPNDAASYVLMASIYADAHMWEDLMEITMRLRQAHPIKPKGGVLPEHFLRKLTNQRSDLHWE
ncbi:hypothetical protein GOP47_0016896 [Adiantum capillus-veneris]|uniref:Pentatricopeptide repeat-containing protein n=1 Tax=Adiantum capillus-veneris TaxID=13818 RepID=A0A9D4UJH9_ADICA|nr:hypothetical protein GOP47_0016896 [Adiantum capillus-veneris]